MGLTGNFAGLERAAARVSGLVEVPRKLKTYARSRLQRAVAREFRGAKDPYGRAWAPLSPRSGGGKKRPLWRGDMRKSLKVRVSGNTLVISVDSPAQYHQVGRHNMPARPIFPTHGLPESYRAALREAADLAANGLKPRRK